MKRRDLFKSLAGLAAGIALGKGREPHMISTNVEGTDVRDLGPVRDYAFHAANTGSYTTSNATFTIVQVGDRSFAVPAGGAVHYMDRTYLG